MTQITIPSFHADPLELIRLAIKWSEELDLVVGLEQLGENPSLNVIQRPVDNLPDGPGQVLLRIDQRPINLIVKSRLPTPERNLGTMFIYLGRQTGDVLYDSRLGVVCVDDAATKIWATFRRRALASMLCGSTLMSPANNVVRRDPSHRYTEGALQLWKSGVRLSAGGGVTYWDDLTPDAN